MLLCGAVTGQLPNEICLFWLLPTVAPQRQTLGRDQTYNNNNSIISLHTKFLGQ